MAFPFLSLSLSLCLSPYLLRTSFGPFSVLNFRAGVADLAVYLFI